MLVGGTLAAFAGDDVAGLCTGESSVTYDVYTGYWIVKGTQASETINCSAVPSYFMLQIDSGKGDDTVTGGQGDDVLNGGQGNDTINGGQGLDTMNGGGDNDSCFGGQAADSGNSCELLDLQPTGPTWGSSRSW